ncbi:hypothetical protein BGW38_005875, partial [Lunasporangiospora selenospora]
TLMDAESDPTACTTSPPVSTKSPMATMVEALDAHMKSNLPTDSMLTPRDMNCSSSAPPPPLLAHARQGLESSSSSNSTGCSCSSHIQPAVRCKHESADQKHEPTEEATTLSMILPSKLPMSVNVNFSSSKDTAPEQNHSTAYTVPEHSDQSRFDPSQPPQPALPSTTPPCLSSEAVTTGPEHPQPRQLSIDANKTFSAVTSVMTTVDTTTSAAASTANKGTIPKEPWIGAGVVASASENDSPVHNSDTWATGSSPIANTSTTTTSSTDPTPAPMPIPALNVHGLQDHSHSSPTTPSSATSPVSFTSSSPSILSSSSLSEYLVIGQSQEPLEREDSESEDRRSDRSFPDSVHSQGNSSSNDIGNSSGSGSESQGHPYSSRSARTSARHSHAQSGADSGSDHSHDSRDSHDSVSDPQIRAPRPTRPYHRHRHQDIHGASGHRPSTPSPPSPPLQSPSPSSRPPHSYPHQQTGFSRRRDAYEEGYLPELVQERRRA